MRVALDGLPLSSELTGVGHYTLEVARGLADGEKADEVHVLSPRAFVPAVTESYPRFKLRRILNPVVRQFWSFHLPRYLRSQKIEIFHGTNYELPTQVVSPTVLTIHDLSRLIYPETHERRNVEWTRRRLPDTARRATMIVCPTSAVRGEINEHLGVPLERIVAIPEAARACFYQEPLSEGEEFRRRLGVRGNFLLYVGTVEPRKNLQRLVHACEQLFRSREDCQLVIAGRRGWMIDDLFDHVKRSAVSNRIIFTGYLTDIELRHLYSACAVFVYPSLYEGFGLPPIEAMACGAPVIASNIASIEEVLGAAAWLIDPADEEGLAAAIEELLAHPAKRSELRERGLARAAAFSWEATVERLREVYKEARERDKRG